jgi:hypothetical protein
MWQGWLAGTIHGSAAPRQLFYRQIWEELSPFKYFDPI